MLLGPVFAVELITSGRRKRYFVLRVVYALILLASLWSSYESVTGFRRATSLAQNANVAAEFFQTFSIVQILAVLVAGPAMVAGTIAVERERRTIEDLLASDLSN